MKNAHTLWATLLLAIGLWGPTGKTVAQEYADQSRLSEGQWYRIAIQQTGVYRLSSSQLPSLQGIHCDSIGLYGAEGGLLSTSNSAPHADDLPPAAMEVVDLNGNGLFDADDYLLFYAEGPSVWRYSTPSDRYEYAMHPYATHNCYYLTPNRPAADNSPSLRVQTAHYDSGNRPDIHSYTALNLLHEDRVNTHGSGQIWVGDKFTPAATSRTYRLSLPAVPTQGGTEVRYALACLSSAYAHYSVQCGEQSRTHTFASGVTYQTFRETFTHTDSIVSLTFSFSATEGGAEGYMDFIELNALVPLHYGGGQLHLRNKQQLGDGLVGRFVATGNAQGMRLWDVTDPTQPQAIEVTRDDESHFHFAAPTDQARTFLAFTDADALIPTDITPLPNQDIHGTAAPDYVIVAHADLLQPAQRLAQMHRQHNGLSVLVLTQEEVFNEFSSGKADPMALRHMMRCLRKRAGGDNSDAPRYLLLLGKGTYDNRDLLGAHQRTVITYQSPASFDDEGISYPSDDLYGYLQDNIQGPFDGQLTVGIGRLPAKSVEEADHMVDKIEAYMTRRDLQDETIRGDWRNYVALLADDADPSNPVDTNFASDSEQMAQRITQLYPHLNIDRIYADAYIQQSGADGSYYPDVNNALRQRINYGCLLLNYIGHGSSTYIGTERYMQFSDIEQYSNHDRLSFFVTSTCTFGKYDQLQELCGAEAFLLADAAGVGVVAAARPIHHISRFNADVCLYALNPSNSIGDALRMAKNNTAAAHCIGLLGDPALHLSVPQNQVTVTHVNQHPVQPNVADSAQVLSRVTISGEIQNPQGERLTDFNGTLYPIVFDRPVRCRTLANDNDSTEVEFVQQKNILYKGRETVTEGRFEYSFIVPRDVAYRYDYAKLSHYARTSTQDATGQYGGLMLGGFNESVVIDELFPTIHLYMGDSTFRDGGLTNETPTLVAHLTDSVGINAAGSGLGHDITATLDGNPYSTVTLNDYYEPDLLDSRGGTVRYTLGKLDEGEHTLTLKCWNIYNYSSSATLRFRVANDRVAQISAVYASPNPASHYTLIRAEHNQPDAIQQATLYLYDIRGQRLRQVSPTVGNNVVSYSWDFTDESGTLLPRGVYIARLLLTTEGGEQLSQTAKIIRN